MAMKSGEVRKEICGEKDEKIWWLLREREKSEDKMEELSYRGYEKSENDETQISVSIFFLFAFDIHSKTSFKTKK